MKELKTYNPDLLDKDRLLVITKSDLLDQELQKEISLNLDMDHVFISSISRQGLGDLKDCIWNLLTKKNV